MKRILFILTVPAMLMACGGSQDHTGDEGAVEANQATEADLETVKQSERIEHDVESTHDDLDSIIQSL
jgi:hypothetical protein